MMPKLTKEPVKNTAKSYIYLLLCFALPFCLIVGLQQLFIRNYDVPSASMESTLMIGDRVFGLKKNADFVPEHGEIVVFKDTLGWLAGTGYAKESYLVKRVIGLPGDTIECCSPEGYVLVNGKPLVETYIQGANSSFPAQTVPEGTMFVMGDNREFSADSRYHIEAGTQFVPLSSIESTAWMIYFPFDHFTVL